LVGLGRDILKTRAYLYIIVPIHGLPWYGVFDSELGDNAVLKVFHDETGNEVGKITMRVVNYHGSVLPEVRSEVLFALEKDLLSGNWFENQFTLLSLNQPIIFEYLKLNSEQHGEIVGLTGLVVYRLLESQAEAEKMT